MHVAPIAFFAASSIYEYEDEDGKSNRTTKCEEKAHGEKFFEYCPLNQMHKPKVCT